MGMRRLLTGLGRIGKCSMHFFRKGFKKIKYEAKEVKNTPVSDKK